jgi:hypothetical protein
MLGRIIRLKNYKKTQLKQIINMRNLEKLQIGDKVVVYDTYNQHISTVTIADRNRLFDKRSGHGRRDSGFNISSIKPATDEDITKITRENNIRRMVSVIRNVSWEKVKYEDLLTIYNIIKTNNL